MVHKKEKKKKWVSVKWWMYAYIWMCKSYFSQPLVTWESVTSTSVSIIPHRIWSSYQSRALNNMLKSCLTMFEMMPPSSCSCRQCEFKSQYGFKSGLCYFPMTLPIVSGHPHAIYMYITSIIKRKISQIWFDRRRLLVGSVPARGPFLIPSPSLSHSLSRSLQLHFLSTNCPVIIKAKMLKVKIFKKKNF